MPVIFTQHGHRDINVDGGSLAWHFTEKHLIAYGSKTWEIMPELNMKKSDILINEKRRYDAFYGTILGDILHQYRVSCLSVSKMFRGR